MHAIADFARTPTTTPETTMGSVTVLCWPEEEDRRRRLELARTPRLDEDGLLWSGQSWVVIPDTQLCIAELLLAHPNQLVSTAAMTATYVRNGSSGHRSSVRTMLNRVVGRFAQVGLQVHIVRGKGALLELPGR